MSQYSLEHRGNEELRRDLNARFASERVAIADLVAHIAEFDARTLYKDAGHVSMHEYCMKIGRLSEDAAYRRLTVARAARKFPRLFQDLAEGGLNLSAVCMLSAHLTPDNVDEYVTAARSRSNVEIRDWLAARLVSWAQVPKLPERQLEVRLPGLASTRVNPGPALPLEEPVEPVQEVLQAPTADSGPVEFEMRFTVSREDHERFHYAQALLSHAIPSGDVAEVFRRAIEAVIRECEKRKFSATDRQDKETAGEKPGKSKSKRDTRHIPAHVRRTVWMRDGGRCTSLMPSGHRCRERRFLEFDHATPVARGGPSTVENVRLRCRAHNQDDAKRVLGSSFMRRKREEAAVVATIRKSLPTWKADPSRRGGS